MKKSRSLTKNYIFNLTYTILNSILPLLTAPYLARVIGADGVGTYAYYYSIAHFFYIFSKLGLNNYGTREIAKCGDTYEEMSYTFSSIYYQQLITTGIANIAYIIYCFAFLQGDGNQIYAIILGVLVFASFFDIDWLYSGLENFRSIAIKNIIVKSCSVVLIFLLVKEKSDLWLYTLIMALSMFGGYASLWFGRRRYVRFRRVAWKDIIKHIKPNLILVIPILAISVYRSMDKIMIGNIVGAVETGLYENAEKIVYALCGFITALGTVMMPRTSQLLARGEREKNFRYMNLSMQFMMMLLWGMVFGLVAISNELVLVLFGSEFQASGVLLASLAFTLPFIGWANIVRSQYVIPINKDRIYVITVSCGAIINLIVNFLLIPRLGAFGAVIGTICAEGSIPVVQFIILHKEIPYRSLIKSCWCPIVAGIIMLLCLTLIGNLLHFSMIINVGIEIIVGLLIYLILILIYIYFFDRDLLKFVKNIFVRKKNK